MRRLAFPAPPEGVRNGGGGVLSVDNSPGNVTLPRMTHSDHYRQLLKSLPSGLTQKEVATRLGLPYQTARQLIARARYRSEDGRRFRPGRKFVPENADWTASNADLAREFGVSRERVRQFRKALGKPFVESRGRKPASV